MSIQSTKICQWRYMGFHFSPAQMLSTHTLSINVALALPKSANTAEAAAFFHMTKIFHLVGYSNLTCIVLLLLWGAFPMQRCNLLINYWTMVWHIVGETNQLVTTVSRNHKNIFVPSSCEPLWIRHNQLFPNEPTAYYWVHRAKLLLIVYSVNVSYSYICAKRRDVEKRWIRYC